MPKLFGRTDKKKEKEKKKAEKERPADKQPRKSLQATSPTHQHMTVHGANGKDHSNTNSASSVTTGGQSTSPSPSASSQELTGLLHTSSSASMHRKDSGMKVAAQRAFFEDLSLKTGTVSPGSVSPQIIQSPEKKRRPVETSGGPNGSPNNRVSISVLSPNSGNRTPLLPGNFPRPGSGSSSRPVSEYLGRSSPGFKRNSYYLENNGLTNTEIGGEKAFEGVYLPLPPLQTTVVRLREVEAKRNAQGGGFGFILRKSYLPVPEEPDKTKLVHLIEPRGDYFGPLMTGDRIIEVNGEFVEDAPHEAVVEMIKASGDCVDLKVASMPELLELNSRGALDDPFERNTGTRRSGKAKQGTGTLRRQRKGKGQFKAKTEAEVLLEREGLSQERVWVVHKAGFTLGTVVQDTPKKPSSLATHVSFFRVQTKELSKVNIEQTGQILEVEDEDLAKANPMSLDKVEDLVNLVHLNEASILHVLRQRYGSSLIHTFAGRHLIVLNPLKPLSSYVDRVIDMFRGCRREDMPPHIFAMAQQAYRDMMVSRSDQSLILMGLSGSGKTFNARYLLRYLTTIGQPEHGPVTNAKLDAVELLLHSFSSAATFLNPQATRCGCLYSLNFDPSGTIVGAAIQTYLLEKNRIAQRPPGEGSFNIFYQLIAGADEVLTQELLLDAPVETDDLNLFYDELDDPQREESAGYVWDLIQNCLDILGISEEEALGLWSLLAAIYHLGFANVKKGSVRGSDYFLNPAAARRAAAVLGVDHETLAQDIFSPPRGGTMRVSSALNSSSSSPSQSDTTSIASSLFLSNVSSSRSVFLDSFVMGLYDQAFNALVMLINRSLQPQIGAKSRSVIHVLDTPGFQHRELAGARNGASFDDLCMNYVQERLQMLFHDVTFTAEQDRYIQEEINWMFSEVAASPLAVIDTIDRHVPQRRGGSVDLHTDRRGLLWILDEESVFPGASDSSFLDRIHIYHGTGSGERGDVPLIKVMKEDNQFIINHCQQTLPVLYDADEWVRKAREHPSFRVVVQTLAASKRPSVACIFQGRGVAASATTLGTSQLKADAHRSLTRSGSSQSSGKSFTSPSSGIKKSSICLQTKFKIDFLVDMLRKTRQWFIRCILPQFPRKLPGALPSPEENSQEDDQGMGSMSYIDMDVPLVRDQLKRAELIKAARIYKQGFPEHIPFDAFCRRYSTLLPSDFVDSSVGKKDIVEMVLYSQGLDRNSYRVGLSQAFLRAGTLTSMDRQVEENIHKTMVLFQARCRGWLGRKSFEKLEVQDSAALVIQQNVLSYLEVRDWGWWNLFLKVKPLLAIWRAEEDIKDRDSKIEKLKAKVESLESERDGLKESEAILEGKVTQLSAQLEDIQGSAHEASEMIEGEQVEKRELEEKLAETMGHETELVQINEQLHMQIAEMSILARIKQSEDGEANSDSIVEKYYEARRELETLRQRVASEFEDQIESLSSSKRSLEKKLADAESERDDLHRTLAMVRKKAAKLGSEMNDLKLHLEGQQARNAELEKRQRKFDMDLSAAKDDSNSEVQAKVKLAREKELLLTDNNELKEKVKTLEDENKQLTQEKEDLEAELLSSSSTLTSESELMSLKRIKRDMESKVMELEDELDEANMKLDTLQQGKARLELANQTLKQQHGKELEGREEELEQVKVTLNKKLKSISQQLEEMHEEKQAAIKARRDIERELLDYQSRLGNPDTEKKLKKQLRKYKAFLEDTQEQLEHEREMRGNSSIVKSLKNQLEEVQTSEASSVKSYKRLQGDMDELQLQYDEVVRSKSELESRVNELSRVKDDLESRIEEDQDELEVLLEKQRSHISQTSSLQSQLTEANFQVEEIGEAKAALESKVVSLQNKISDLEDGMNRHQVEASEHKIKELEQKLELERSSAHRHESQINRLRHQLERLQDEKSEDVSHKSNDALNRAQKQIRELRSELQEAERKEQEMSKKRRNAEARVDEVEAQLQSTEANLKSSQKRIEQLHGALKDHEEEYSGDDITFSRDNSLDNLSTSGSDYSMDDLEFSDEDEDDVLPRSTRLSLGRSKAKELSPILSDDNLRSDRKKKRSTSSDPLGDDELETARKARQKRLKDLDDDDEFEASRKARRDRLKEDDEFEASRKARRERLKDLDEDDELETAKKARQKRLKDLEGDDEFESSRKARRDRLKDPDDDDEFEASREARKDRLKGLDDIRTANEIKDEKKSTKKTYDDDDDDDDSLEDFLLKQRERMRLLKKDIEEDEDDEEEPPSRKTSTTREDYSSKKKSPVRENGVNSRKNSESRDEELSPRHKTSVEDKAAQVASRYRRKRQRRRTIEQLTSPEHKANGVDL